MPETTSTASVDRIEDEGAKFARLREALDENGELMIRTASGDELELHKHNVTFDDVDAPFFRVDGDDELHWVDARHVERYWIHNDV